MKLLLTIETIEASGHKDISRAEFEKRQIVVGRGASADIRVESRLVSLKHLALYDQGGHMVVEDLGSLSGVLVNDVPITRHVLQEGDEVKFADHSIKILNASSPFEAMLTIHRAENLDLKSQVLRDLLRWDPNERLRLIKPLVIGGAITSIILFALIPSLKESKPLWSPGSLSIPHRPLEMSCSSCHTKGSSSIVDSNCFQCHEMTAHFKSENKISHDFIHRCTDCHSEHRGDYGVFTQASTRCGECHGDIKKIKSNSSLKSITRLSDHREFQPSMSHESGLKFNHKVHLEPNIETRTGNKSLTCQSCHQPDPSTGDRLVISFEKHCQECHSLEFDERIPGVEVPHGKPDEVLRFLYRYKNRLSAPPEEVARLLFRTTACVTCHTVEESQRGYSVNAVKFQSFDLNLKSKIHESHRVAVCESCHSKSSLSERASDSLIPTIKNCQSCHSDQHEKFKIQSDCSYCHNYHDSLSLSPLHSPLMKGVE